ncbi:hypothetical protein SK128_015065 [Halocaridina rubra]|uniref:Uncharacterized protein n=1 Tax=Halocaridina rubra TaxID=373956 RepID=A0AAN8XI60_HALRR
MKSAKNCEFSRTYHDKKPFIGSRTQYKNKINCCGSGTFNRRSDFRVVFTFWICILANAAVESFASHLIRKSSPLVCLSYTLIYYRTIQIVNPRSNCADIT